MAEKSVVGPVCPDCGTDTVAGDRFCEECGTDLLLVAGGMPDETAARPAVACVACGATEIDADGYCTRCGFSQPEVRDRVELDLTGVAGVSDRGLRHHRNEDAMALRVATDPAGEPAHLVVVVCDGVSTSDRPDVASKAAADTAADVLLAAARAGDDLTTATRAAVAAAVSAVTALNGVDGTGNAPACTFVSAVVTGTDITIGWVGDSRAYWLAGREPYASSCLTVDDTPIGRWQAAGGGPASRPTAQTEALIRWVGADAYDVEPHIVTFGPPGPGRVLLCTDGLSRYLSAAHDLAAAATQDPPEVAARRLTRLALDAGGQDNITVVIMPFPPEGGGPLRAQTPGEQGR